MLLLILNRRSASSERQLLKSWSVSENKYWVCWCVLGRVDCTFSESFSEYFMFGRHLSSFLFNSRNIAIDAAAIQLAHT